MSSQLLGVIASALIGGYLVERLGLRGLSIVTSLAFALGIVGVALETDMITCCSGKFLMGKGKFSLRYLFIASSNHFFSVEVSFKIGLEI